MRPFSSVLWCAAAVAGVMLGLGVGACSHSTEPGTSASGTPTVETTPRGGGPVVVDTKMMPVKLVKNASGQWQLLRDGKPYFIKGAGGDASKPFLAEIGGNSFRTWGIGNDTPGKLAEAQKLGLTVTLGYWLGHKEQGFNWDNAAAVQRQFDEVKADVEKYKDSPPVLIWALGNEMENAFKGDDAIPMWKHVEELAAMVHKEDPNHPTMTVVAEIGGDKVAMINKYCPDINIIGINSYAGCSSIADRYVKAGGVKPYVITEFGPPGVWEWHQNDTSFGAVQEPNSTEKAAWYRKAYMGSIAPGHPDSLGSYVFAWGSKQEATATWYGLIMSEGNMLCHTAAVDTMEELWTGHAPAIRAPEVKSAALVGVDPKVGAVVPPGGTVKATSDIVDPQGLPLTYQWRLFMDPQNYNTGGENQAAPPEFPGSIVQNGMATVEVKLPRVAGKYRLFLYAYNGKGGVATANFPIDVAGAALAMTPEEKAAAQAKPTKLPFAIYSEATQAMPWNPTGFMPATIGTTLTLDAKCTDNPHSGKTCIKVSYGANGGWGGIVWQNPDNNWGTLVGGYDLTGAKVLSFWARGANGGEKATFGMGLITHDPKKVGQLCWDSGSAKLENVILTKDWKHYTISLEGKDLSRIITGFWLVTGPTSGGPTTFYLDDMEYSADNTAN